MVDEGSDSVGEVIEGSDYIFLTAPVDINLRFLDSIKPFLLENTVVTDAGSVKGIIMDAARDSGLSECFIGGHPMAGSERSGYANSSADLLRGAYYIITPYGDSRDSAVDALKTLVISMGSVPIVMSPEEHDRSTALVSHLPHVSSAALVNMLQNYNDPHGILKTIAAGGFRDITRISSSDPGLWRQICMENRVFLSGFIKDYSDMLLEFKEDLDNGNYDALETMFSRAKDYRDSMGK